MSNSLYKIYVKASNTIARSPACKKALNLIYPVVKPLIYKANTFNVSTSDFLFLQHKDGVFIRPDMIIRYMFLDQHYGTDHFGLDAVELYEKMQDYRNKLITGKEMTAKFYRLIDSYEKNGYKSNYPVEVDKNLLIRDGSHRTALALYLGIPQLTVHRTNQNLPTDYKLDLFEKTNFTDKEKECVYTKLDQLLDKFNLPLNIVLWDDAIPAVEDICQDLKTYGEIIDCKKYTYGKKAYKSLEEKLFKTKNISAAGKNITAQDEKSFAVIKLKLNNVIYKPLNDPKKPVISDTASIEKLFRTKYLSGNADLCTFACVPSNFMENSSFTSILPDSEKQTAAV